MESTKRTFKEREIPRSHLLHISSAIIMILIIILDSFVFDFSTQILSFIPWTVRLILCILVLALALIFIIRAHNVLFGGEKHEQAILITTGIFNQVRNPMYFGILLIHFAFILLTMSLIAFCVWIIVILIYDKMATYEEEILEEMFGEEYREYKNRTSKWIPR